MKTEAGSAGLLVVAAVVALVWANSPWADSYFSWWHTPVELAFGAGEISMDLHHWVNDGLMVVFFFVIGLEVRREFSVGELTDRRRLVVPLVAGVGGMLVPAAIYLALNPSGERGQRLGRGHRHGHRVPARRARPGRAGGLDPAADLPADAHRHRRHRRGQRHRHRVLRVDRAGAPGRRGALPGRAVGPLEGGRVAGIAVRRGDRRAVGRDPAVRAARLHRGHAGRAAGARAVPVARRSSSPRPPSSGPSGSRRCPGSSGWPGRA